MKVRVFDPKPTEAAAAFEPQETPLLGGRDSGLVVQLGVAPGQVAYGDVAALAAFRSVERGSEQSFLLFFLGGRPRPVVAAAGQIRFNEFPVQVSASGSENLRQVAIHLCRQAGSLLVDRSTLTFLQKGGSPPSLEGGMAVLATAFGKMLMPQAVSTVSPHRTRPLPPPGEAAAAPAPRPAPAPATPAPATPAPATPAPAAPPPATPPPATPAPPLWTVEPAPVSTQRRPAVPPGSTVPPPRAAPSTPPPVPPAAPSVPPPAPLLSGAGPPPAPASPPALQPMEVQVFEPAPEIGDPACQPLEVFRVGSGPRGLDIRPENVGGVAFEDVQGIAVFQSSEKGADKPLLMLVVRQGPRPLLAEAGQVAFDEFPIRISTPASENLRQLALYVCQKAGRMVMDRATGIFLQQGRPAPVLESSILSLATAYCRVLPRASQRASPAEFQGFDLV